MVKIRRAAVERRHRQRRAVEIAVGHLLRVAYAALAGEHDNVSSVIQPGARHSAQYLVCNEHLQNRIWHTATDSLHSCDRGGACVRACVSITADCRTIAQKIFQNMFRKIRKKWYEIVSTSFQIFSNPVPSFVGLSGKRQGLFSPGFPERFAKDGTGFEKIWNYFETISYHLLRVFLEIV